MTGLHGIHVLVGMVLISWVTYRHYKGEFSPGYFTAVEGVGFVLAHSGFDMDLFIPIIISSIKWSLAMLKNKTKCRTESKCSGYFFSIVARP